MTPPPACPASLPEADPPSCLAEAGFRLRRTGVWGDPATRLQIGALPSANYPTTCRRWWDKRVVGVTRPRLILASASPRRKKLLTEAGIPFEAIPSRAREVSAFKRPDLIVKELAYKKALSVAIKHPKRPVLGADTLVYCKGRVLGKPKTPKDAMRLLNLQNGSWQTVHTGAALIWLEKKIFLAAGERTRCKARKLPQKTLRYMAEKHLDKAGAYAVQDAGDIFIAKMEGRFDTVVGLSMNLVRKFMKKAGLRGKVARIQ